MEITAPTIEYGLLMPFILIFAGACLGVLVEGFVPRASRRVAQLTIVYAAIAAALFMTLRNWAVHPPTVAAEGSVSVDGPTSFMWVILLIFGAISFLLIADRTAENGASVFAPQAAAVPGTAAEAEAVRAGVEHTEVYPLALFALSGMMLFPASSDLITMFIALEILSLPLYVLCGLARRRRLLSQESSLKYFLLGAMSSAIYLYGAALLYGYAGSFDFSAIDTALRAGTGDSLLLLAGMALVGVGLLFKFGAVPFHSWTPDVYAGAPTAVTAFMAACTKIAAIGALMRVFYVALGADRWDWQPMMAIIAVATMAVGSVVAISQTDVKRMLAYSSIAHAGFLMTAFVGASQASSSGEATLLSSWVGLGRRSPAAAVVFSVFMLSFAGIPLTSGFIGKWAVFAAAWNGGAEWLVVIAVVISVIAAFFYVRVIVLMFFSEPAAGPVAVIKPGASTLVAVGVAVVATVALGLFPGPLLELAQAAGEFVR
jgi:NADH-quinone oxidoreductase subunit N